MAALQKIRSKGVLLVSIIALALFLFVAGDLFRGLESLFHSNSQQIGEVNGESVSVQDYQKMVDDMQKLLRDCHTEKFFQRRRAQPHQRRSMAVICAVSAHCQGM